MNKLILALILAYPSWAAILPVNSVGGGNNSGGTSTTVDAPAASHTSGNLLVVVIRESSSTITSVTDTALNNYTQAVSITSGVDVLAIWFAQNITGNASNVVTAHFAANASYRNIVVLQYSGCDTSSPKDATASATGATGTVTSSAFTTSQADELVVVGTGIGFLGATLTPPTGYTLRANSDSNVAQGSDKVVSAIQTGATLTATYNNNSPNAMVVATFKAATGGGGGRRKIVIVN